MKVVINDCYGGFGLSEAAYKELNIPWDGYGHGRTLEKTNMKHQCDECARFIAQGEYVSRNNSLLCNECWLDDLVARHAPKKNYDLYMAITVILWLAYVAAKEWNLI